MFGIQIRFWIVNFKTVSTKSCLVKKQTGKECGIYRVAFGIDDL